MCQSAIDHRGTPARLGASDKEPVAQSDFRGSKESLDWVLVHEDASVADLGVRRAMRPTLERVGHWVLENTDHARTALKGAQANLQVFQDGLAWRDGSSPAVRPRARGYPHAAAPDTAR